VALAHHSSKFYSRVELPCDYQVYSAQVFIFSIADSGLVNIGILVSTGWDILKISEAICRLR